MNAMTEETAQQLTEALRAATGGGAATAAAAPDGANRISFAPGFMGGASMAAPAAAGWGMPMNPGIMPGMAPAMTPAASYVGGLPQPNGLSFRCTLETPAGDVPFHLHFGAEAAQSYQSIEQLAHTLINMGVPLKIWQPKNRGWGNNNGGGGWGNNGGGGGRYRDRGGYWYGRGGRRNYGRSDW